LFVNIIVGNRSKCWFQWTPRRVFWRRKWSHETQ